MVNQEKYRTELQKIIDNTKSTDSINEHSKEVLETLDHLSIEYAKELQAETGVVSQEDEGIWQYPPYRLLAMNLILSRLIEWQITPEKLYLVSDWDRIEDACDEVRNACDDYKISAGA
jgi:beta-glucosidase/6-phospho-beta-glucosidase/beta-galactosidase